MLKSNLKYLRKKKKLSQNDVANLLGISRSTYANYETAQSEPPASQLLKIAEYFQVSTDDLLTKDIGAPLFWKTSQKTDHILSNDIRILPITVSANQNPNIELVPAKAIAGYLSGMKEAKYISELPRFHLPGLSEGTYRAFEIQGDSMPPIQDGYIVIGKYVEHARDLKSGQRYIVAIRNEGVVFKKVIRELDSHKNLILASDNTEFLPYSVSTMDVLEAWEFTAFIGFPTNIDMNYFLLDKLHDIQQKLALITTNV